MEKQEPKSIETIQPQGNTERVDANTAVLTEIVREFREAAEQINAKEIPQTPKPPQGESKIAEAPPYDNDCRYAW